MTHKKIVYQALSIVLLVGLGVLLFIRYTNQTDGSNFIKQIKEGNKFGFDSLQNAIDQENATYIQLQKSISDSDFNNAYVLIDSLKAQNKTTIAHVYEGMIYERQTKYTQAIEKYNAAIASDPYSIGLSKRAEVYVKMSQFDLALKDYQDIYW